MSNNSNGHDHSPKGCPCGTQLDYLDCCGLFIDGKQNPSSPESLMRSRYTAYTLANIDYIKKTMRGKPLINFDEAEAKKWAKRVLWIGLDIIQTSSDSAVSGVVEFVARYIEGGWLKSIHEISEFICEQAVWYYVDGICPKVPTSIQKQKIMRNAPCPCNSQKKYKNCHERMGVHRS